MYLNIIYYFSRIMLKARLAIDRYQNTKTELRISFRVVQRCRAIMAKRALELISGTEEDVRLSPRLIFLRCSSNIIRFSVTYHEYKFRLIIEKKSTSSFSDVVVGKASAARLTRSP